MPCAVLTTWVTLGLLGSGATSAQGSLSSVFEDIKQETANTNAYIEQMAGKMTALLRICSDDEYATEFLAASSQIHAQSFGQTFVLGTSGLGTFAETYPLIGATTGGSAYIQNLQTLPLEWAWFSSAPAAPGVSAFVYSANFANGPAHVGIACTLDLWTMGLTGSPTAPLRYAIALTPIDVLDPEEPVSASEVLEFMQLASAGYFRASGNLVQWLESKVVYPEGGGGDSQEDPCNTTQLIECVTDAWADYVACQAGAAGVRAAAAARIAAIEAELADAAEGFVDAAIDGAVGGGIGGATGGAIGGPIGSAVGAAAGAAFGAAAGLISQALTGPDVDALTEELNQLKSDAKQAFCDCISDMLMDLSACFHESGCADLWAAIVDQLYIDTYVAYGCLD